MSMKEIKEMVTVYSMAISQSTEYPQMHLASFSRILFTTGDFSWSQIVLDRALRAGKYDWILVCLPLGEAVPFHQ